MPNIVRTVYWSIFRDIDAYSATFTGPQLETRGNISPALFKIKKIIQIILIFLD